MQEFAASPGPSGALSSQTYELQVGEIGESSNLVRGRRMNERDRMGELGSMDLELLGMLR